MKKYKAKLLNEASDKVGIIKKATYYWEKWSGKDLLLTGLGKGERAKEIVPDAVYELKVPIITEVKCKKELKRQLKDGGFQGVADYLEKLIEKRNEKHNRI